MLLFAFPRRSKHVLMFRFFVVYFPIFPRKARFTKYLQINTHNRLRMGKILLAFLVAILSALVYIHLNNKVDYEKVLSEARKDGYFGKGSPRKDDVTISPFTISATEEQLQDLRRRLESSRITHEHLEDANDFWYGFNSKYLQEVKEYWLNKYDWKKAEKLLNSFKHFKTEIEGIKVHFIHAHPPAGKYKKTYPVLMAHGWPGSVFEFHKIIPILTDPKSHGLDSEFAFEVVAPSIPGYGWSEAPKKRGFSQLACARVFRKLMLRLKHDKFYLQGGDWGSLITSMLNKLYPENVIGLHLNSVFATDDNPIVLGINILATIAPKYMLSSKKLQETHNIKNQLTGLLIETGYMHIQGTKPDTVGTALSDSPIGLAAYILEKFSTWTNIEYRNLPDGGLTKKFTLDELLTSVMIYWLNGNIVNSQRFYREFFTDANIKTLASYTVDTPMAHASGMNELYDRTPIEITKFMFNITHYTEIDDVGHFACFEEPKKLAVDIFDFVRSLVH